MVQLLETYLSGISSPRSHFGGIVGTDTRRQHIENQIDVCVGDMARLGQTDTMIVGSPIETLDDQPYLYKFTDSENFKRVDTYIKPHLYSSVSKNILFGNFGGDEDWTLKVKGVTYTCYYFFVYRYHKEYDLNGITELVHGLLADIIKNIIKRELTTYRMYDTHSAIVALRQQLRMEKIYMESAR